MNTTLLPSLNCRIETFPEDRSRLKKKKKPFEEQTIVANVSNDLTYLYSSFIYKKYGIVLEPPPFGAHITIHNGKESIEDIEEHHNYLSELNGKSLTVQYDPLIYLYWRFFAVKVISPELEQIRHKLGLSKKSFHITIGKIKDKDITLLKDGKQTCVELVL